MRTIVSALAIAGLVGLGCADGPATGSHKNAVTGVACHPDPGSYMPRPPGDDTPHVDCTQPHDDVPHGDVCCQFPTPGCDKDGCCDDDVIVEPEPPPPAPPEVL